MFTSHAQIGQIALNVSVLGFDVSLKCELKMERSPEITLPSTHSLDVQPRSAKPRYHDRAVLVDLTHIYTRAQHEGLWIDDVQLYHQLTRDGDELLGVFAYLVIRPDQQEKVESLRRIGYQVSPRVVQTRSDNSETRKDIDTWLISDASLYAPFVKTLVVVSSDSDYAYPLRKLKQELNKRIEVIYFSEQSLSSELRFVADKCTPITALPGVCKPRLPSRKPER